MQLTRVIGIDLGEVASHVAAIYDPAAHTWVRKQFRFRTRPTAVEKLIHLARQQAEEAQLVAVMEATGMAWWPLAFLLHQHGVRIYRLNGLQVKEYKKSLRRSGFSDRTDAQALALMYPQHIHREVPLIPPTPDQVGLQMACRHYATLRDHGVALANRLQARDRAVWGEQGLKGLAPRVAWPWIRSHWYDPLQVANTSLSHLTQAWLDHVKQAQLASRWQDTSWISRWHAQAQERQKIFTPHRCMPLIAETVAQEQRFYEMIQAQRDTWQAHVVALHSALYPQDVLLTLPGVGPLTAAIYRAFVGDIHRFPNLAAFRAWTGLVPHSRASGTYRSRGGRITKAGPNLVKETLFLNAGVARLWDVELGALYYRMRVTYNHPHTKAQIVVATHLANRLYAVWKRGTPYLPRDLQGRPITPKEAHHLIRSRYAIPKAVRQRQRRHP